MSNNHFIFVCCFSHSQGTLINTHRVRDYVKRERITQSSTGNGEGEEQMRLHFEITEKTYQRVIELMEKEVGAISHDRRTELFYQAIEEFPDEDQQM